jgi:hypothetical protein
MNYPTIAPSIGIIIADKKRLAGSVRKSHSRRARFLVDGLVGSEAKASRKSPQQCGDFFMVTINRRLGRFASIRQ